MEKNDTGATMLEIMAAVAIGLMCLVIVILLVDRRHW